MSNDELVSMTMAQLVCFASLVDVLVDHHGLRRADLADALEQATPTVVTGREGC